MPCRSLPVIPNGSIIDNFKQPPYQNGEQLQFECNNGYTFQPFPYVKCHSSGEWKGGRCLPKSCGDPGHVPNAERHGLVFTFPSSVTYKCNRGYIESGSKPETFCQVNGEWFPPISRFSCTAITCPKPKNIKNGQVIYEDRTVNSLLTYTCAPGFQLMGKKQRTCLENGQWSGINPKCDPIKCHNPGGGVIIEPNKPIYDWNELVHFKCGTNFILSKCADQDRWTNISNFSDCNDGDNGGNSSLPENPPPKPPLANNPLIPPESPLTSPEIPNPMYKRVMGFLVIFLILVLGCEIYFMIENIQEINNQYQKQ